MTDRFRGWFPAAVLLGAAIRIDTRGREVMRILPRDNDDVNEEWISDKARHVVDGLRTQRLDQPYIREHGRLRPASWPAAFAAAMPFSSAGRAATQSPCSTARKPRMK